MFAIDADSPPPLLLLPPPAGEGKMFSPGNLRATFDNPAYEKLIAYYIGEKYTLRYTGGMVSLGREAGAAGALAGRRAACGFSRLLDPPATAYICCCALGRCASNPAAQPRRQARMWLPASRLAASWRPTPLPPTCTCAHPCRRPRLPSPPPLQVPDVFQIIVKEKGVFTNVTSPSTKAKLRLLFEVAPLALLVEKAGGASSCDGLCVSGLDVEVTQHDQRTQICYGSVGEVKRFEEYVYGSSPRFSEVTA